MVFTMCNYWLYILKHEYHVEGCTLALSVSPTERDVQGQKLQTVQFKSWADLFGVLAKVGISSEFLRHAKATLDSEGLETLREIPLSEGQLHTLGFRTTRR